MYRNIEKYILSITLFKYQAIRKTKHPTLCCIHIGMNKEDLYSKGAIPVWICNIHVWYNNIAYYSYIFIYF